jgi:hypothetical protein
LCCPIKEIVRPVCNAKWKFRRLPPNTTRPAIHQRIFLSSGIIRNANYTMEQSVSVARRLRATEDEAGNAEEILAEPAGGLAD